MNGMPVWRAAWRCAISDGVPLRSLIVVHHPGNGNPRDDRHGRRASFETHPCGALLRMTDICVWYQRFILILRRPRRGRLEGRTIFVGDPNGD